MNRVVPKSFIIIAIIVGLSLFFGATVCKKINDYNYKHYIETTGSFINTTRVYTEDGTIMYHLNYKYIVNGQEFYYTTDYATSSVPKKGSTIIIRYNSENPNMAYSKSFNVFSLFQIIGASFVVVSLIILFSEWIWFRDILLFLGSSSLLIIFIINNFYTGYSIIFLIILAIFCLLSLIEFILCLKNDEFHPLIDIKKDINLSKKIKHITKKREKNLSQEQIKKKYNKIKKVIKGLLLFIVPMPLVIFINIKFGYPNQIIYYIFAILATICTLIGFFTAGLTLTGMDNGPIVIAGKVINNKDIQNKNKMTLLEKIKTFNIIHVIIRILQVPSGFGLLFLLINIKIFVNMIIVKIILFNLLIIIFNRLYIKFSKKKFLKISIIISIAVECILTWYYFYSLFYLS